MSVKLLSLTEKSILELKQEKKIEELKEKESGLITKLKLQLYDIMKNEYKNGNDYKKFCILPMLILGSIRNFLCFIHQSSWPFHLILATIRRKVSI